MAPGSVPYKGRRGAGEVPHLQLLNDVVARWGWNDTQIAHALGVNTSRIRRWRRLGVANGYVPALGALKGR
jgi:hypothetical protein